MYNWSSIVNNATGRLPRFTNSTFREMLEVEGAVASITSTKYFMASIPVTGQVAR
jgi:hypothetical protein